MKEAQKKYISVDMAHKQLESFCAYQERSHKEVEEKLNKLGIIREAQEQIIISLIQDNYLNEQRFAEAFVRGKFRIKKWGRHKIKQALVKHDLSSYALRKAFEQISSEEYEETLRSLAESKLRSLENKGNSSPKANKQKLIQHLSYKGYENDLIYPLVNQLIPW